LYFEQYERKSHGYQVECCHIKLRTSEQSVEEKIRRKNYATQKERCQNAYDYLVTANDSSYSHFLRLREKIIAEGTSLNLFHFSDTRGIECALWPNLYPFSAWCESNISDSGSRLSMKVSFHTKLLSEILDYALHYDLLQFQYDRWLYKTVSGAISTTRFLKCSPARSLDTKTFSATYWQWQHRYLLDVVYKQGNTLGLKLVSYFNKDYFFQYILMNLPHTSLSQLKRPDHDRIPSIPATLQWYAAAVLRFPDFWNNNEKLTDFLHNQGNRDHFVTTYLAFVATLKDMFFLWQMQIIQSHSFDIYLFIYLT
jgi:hypothetical protein